MHSKADHPSLKKKNSGAHSRVATLIQPSFQKKKKIFPSSVCVFVPLSNGQCFQTTFFFLPTVSLNMNEKQKKKKKKQKKTREKKTPHPFHGLLNKRTSYKYCSPFPPPPFFLKTFLPFLLGNGANVQSWKKVKLRAS